MTCVRIPLSLADAEAIAVCAGGPDWRTPFLYGLGTVAVFVVFVALGFVLVRTAAR